VREELSEEARGPRRYATTCASECADAKKKSAGRRCGENRSRRRWQHSPDERRAEAREQTPHHRHENQRAVPNPAAGDACRFVRRDRARSPRRRASLHEDGARRQHPQKTKIAGRTPYCDVCDVVLVGRGAFARRASRGRSSFGVIQTLRCASIFASTFGACARPEQLVEGDRAVFVRVGRRKEARA